MVIGEKIGDYLIISPIAEGGMGRVFLAREELSGEHVAVKILPEHFLKDRKRSQYLRREVEIARNLRHPNVINIFELLMHEGVGYLMMEYIDGGNLRQYTKRKNLTLYEVLDLVQKICEGLHYIHNHQLEDGRFHSIIHRDIKPENILISKAGRPKVADFGLSFSDESWNFRRRRSRSGTPYYMSPEQIRGKPLDIRTDIFSLGLVVYELLTGQLPYKAAGKDEYMKYVISKKTKPAPPSYINKKIPRQLDRITMRALEKNPADRYQTVTELILDLKRLPAVLKRLSF